MSELNLISTQQPGLVAVNNFDQLKETLQAMTERRGSNVGV